jgi:osmotically-inducible protein OsmY
MTHAPRSPQADRALRDAALAAIAWVALAGPDVDVVVQHGTVTVRGTVRCIADRDRVLAAALGAPGVQVVVDDLQVRSMRDSVASDEVVAAHLHDLIATMPSVHVEGVLVRVRQGVVTVRGEIPWPFERDTLVNLVGAIDGVRDVVDALVVRDSDQADLSGPGAPAAALRPSGTGRARG